MTTSSALPLPQHKLRPTRQTDAITKLLAKYTQAYTAHKSGVDGASVAEARGAEVDVRIRGTVEVLAGVSVRQEGTKEVREQNDRFGRDHIRLEPLGAIVSCAVDGRDEYPRSGEGGLLEQYGISRELEHVDGHVAVL